MKVIRIFVIALACLGVAEVAGAVCREERTTGVDWNQARYNCEVILQGEATSCQPYGNMWGCRCMVGCGGGGGGGNFTRTTGADYNQARYNCEVILRGNASRCTPYGNIWACDCYY